jgi:hypothetical protein
LVGEFSVRVAGIKRGHPTFHVGNAADMDEHRILDADPGRPEAVQHDRYHFLG